MIVRTTYINLEMKLRKFAKKRHVCIDFEIHAMRTVSQKYMSQKFLYFTVLINLDGKNNWIVKLYIIRRNRIERCSRNMYYELDATANRYNYDNDINREYKLWRSLVQ